MDKIERKKFTSVTRFVKMTNKRPEQRMTKFIQKKDHLKIASVFFSPMLDDKVNLFH